MDKFSSTGYEPCYNCPTGSNSSISGSKNCTRLIVQPPSPVDYCVNSPCGIHQCQSKSNNYVCVCNMGYRGNTCQTPLDPCTSHLCKNGGTCISNPSANAYTCSCTEAYGGQYCDQEKASSASQWGEWQFWDPCSASDCGEGVETRTRVCVFDTNQTPCSGSYDDSRHCNLPSCQDCSSNDLQFPAGTKVTCSSVGSNLTCTVSCDADYEYNSSLPVHTCSNGVWSPGRAVTPCDRSAGWSVWSNWTRCLSCNDSRTRSRSCNSPPSSASVQPCSGSNTETMPCTQDQELGCSDCNESDLVAASGAEANCTGTASSMTCEVLCSPGLVCLEIPPVYRCNYGYWTPSKQLIPCTSTVPAQSVSLTFTATYPSVSCSNQTLMNSIKQQLEQKTLILDCLNKSLCSVNINTDCNSNINTGRKRRATGDTIVNMALTSQQNVGNLDLDQYVNNGQVSSTLQQLVTSLDTMDKSAQQIKDDSSFFSVNTDNGPTLPGSIEANGVISCTGQSISLAGVCIECPPGTHHNGSSCVLCESGSYQELSAQSSCKPCPNSGTTVTVGSYGISQCTGVSTSIAPCDDNMLIAIIVPIVLVILIVVIAILVYIYKKKKGNAKISDEENKELKYNGNGNGAKSMRSGSIIKVHRGSSVAPLSTTK
ncbi:neurogenic locus notch homolog protein 1 [Patella vulgata]|uniref:neurogenic locus notch homolog protein 1 n=1 Tax=Patella vulgata TaxID=6465 RepID=UPI0021801CC4|nr:neurogenic locus notch homolog protein 1 [Patella vulgata]